MLHSSFTVDAHKSFLRQHLACCSLQELFQIICLWLASSSQTRQLYSPHTTSSNTPYRFFGGKRVPECSCMSWKTFQWKSGSKSTKSESKRRKFVSRVGVKKVCNFCVLFAKVERNPNAIWMQSERNLNAIRTLTHIYTPERMLHFTLQITYLHSNVAYLHSWTIPKIEFHRHLCFL